MRKWKQLASFHGHNGALISQHEMKTVEFLEVHIAYSFYHGA